MTMVGVTYVSVAIFQVVSSWQPSLSFGAQVDIKGMPGIPYHIFEETVMKSRGTHVPMATNSFLVTTN